MPSARHPIVLLYESAKVELAAVGDTTKHAFGERELSAHASPPRYVWIPTRTKEGLRSLSTVAVDQPRTLLTTGEYFEVHCWGESFDQAWILRQNVMRVLKRLAAADIQVEHAEWTRPGQSWVQKGELFVLEASLSVPLFDQHIDVATGVYPDEATFIPTRFEGTVESSESEVEEGEFGVQTTT